MKSKTLKFQKKPIVVEAYQTDVEITIDTSVSYTHLTLPTNSRV